MTKQEFAAKLAEQEGIEKKQAAAWTDAVIKALKDAVAQK
jgi:nucleoid DNA-binding protein